MINSPRILPRPRRRLPAARPPLPRGAETVITSPRILPRPRRRLPAARPPLPRGAAAVIDSLRILPRPRGRLSPARPPLPRGAAAVITSPRILPRPRRRLSAALPPRPRGAAAPPPAAAVAVTDEGGVGPRRSFRISLRPRVRVVPWVKPPVARKPKDPAKSPRPSIEALAAEWAKEKAASGAPEEECVLPFLQKGAPKKEAFRRLPLPHTFQEFSIDPIKKEELDNGTEPPPYTQYCGWGSRALEAIEKDDFVIEFVGEVIDDETCEERLEDMRRRGDKNFYMCKVKKDFVIDATFKGNDCRFFNHSCEPNCQLQKWQVNGKTRLGVFASKAIEVGEPLTYDYRFEQHFGPEIECFCGAQNCQGNMSVSGKD
uniref:SET domain-containing protein n=1 Tax=Oryza meridionalis TaxID=40149 RepID=A0A0E0EM28_9ORYZ